jgi:putative drug exporter of the RND superfamily
MMERTATKTYGHSGPRERTRIGRFIRVAMGRRSRWVVLGVWVVITAVSLPFALRIGSAQSNDLLALLPSKAHST